MSFFNIVFLSAPIKITLKKKPNNFKNDDPTSLRHSLIVSQWSPWLMTYLGHDIVVMSTFHSLIRHRGHHDECRMRSRKCLPFRSTWFHLWFS